MKPENSSWPSGMVNLNGFSDEDAEKVVGWAVQARINQEMLDMLIQHRLTVSIGPDGGVLMGLPKGGTP